MNSVRNILLTSAGRRVSLVRNFQDAIKHRNPGGLVCATDMLPGLSSACQVADRSEKVPRVTDPDYGAVLLEICKRNEIDIIIPTIDTELTVLSGLRDEFLRQGIHCIVSDVEFCRTFGSKRSTEKAFRESGISTPLIIDNPVDADYPLFAKLDNSSCSLGAERVDSYERVKELTRRRSGYVFQEYLRGDEYTVDVFVCGGGQVISVVPRKRLEVRAGEVSKAVTVKDPKIIGEVRRLLEKLPGAYGPLTVQLFRTVDHRLVFIEINPRFGGGYPLSWKAGANFADYILREFSGETLEWDDSWKDGTLMLRYDGEVILDGHNI